MAPNDVVRTLAQEHLRRYPREAAPLLERLPATEVAELLASHDPQLAADVLRRLRADVAGDVISELAEPAASRIVGALEPAVAAALLARLDADARAARLASLDATLAGELRELMSYPPGVAGALMDPRVASFRPDATAREALARIRALRHERNHDLFLVDDEHRLTGAVTLQDLALADGDARLDELARGGPPPHVQALTPNDELVALVEDWRVTSVPVVDVSGRLLGVIRHGDLLTVTQHDATADIQTMVGVSKEERALSSVGFAVRKRLPWLQINLLTAFLAAAVVGLFEGTIARFSALAVLLPVVAGQSGNTGAQALAVTMRGLALREIRVRHWPRVGGKELAVAFVNGVAVALVTSLGVLVWSRSVALSGVIGVAMLVSMIVAGFAGASVPMILTLLRQDPAASASIILTTVTDVIGFLTFLGFATLAAGLL